MFTGIIEDTTPALTFNRFQESLQMTLKRPPQFTDLKLGDSVAVNGTCLTIEKLDSESLQVTIGHETLKVLGLTAQKAQSLFANQVFNLERPMLLSDRVHGHLVTGHVDAVGEVEQSEEIHDGWLLKVKFPESLNLFFWKKGSVCLHGVSLTINEVQSCSLSVFLIPETLRKTNLKNLKPGQPINIEADYLAKTIVNAMQSGALQNVARV